MKKVLRTTLCFFTLLGTAEPGQSQTCPPYSTMCYTSTGQCCSQPKENCPATCTQANIAPQASTVYSLDSGAIFFCLTPRSVLVPAKEAPITSKWVTCGASNELYSSSAQQAEEPATPETVYAIKNDAIFSCAGNVAPVLIPNSTIYYTCPVTIGMIKDGK